MYQSMYQSKAQGIASLAPVFVVGTGRCGSTMLSNMFRQHSEILSLSELFAFVTDLGSLVPQAFPEGDVSPSRFWDILSASYHKQNLMLRYGVAMDEVLYPTTSPGARFNAESGVPALLQTTLPHVTPEHDVLFDEIQAFVQTLPPGPIELQYTRLFGWLQQRFKKRLWVERSGGSLRIITRLRRHFPEAKFVHIVRDGRDCAMSMSRHYGFRMVLIAFYLTEVMGLDPFEDDDRSAIEDVSDEFYPFLPEHFDAEAFRNYDVSPSLYGHYWSGELMAALPTLVEIVPENMLMIRFEDFLAAPEPVLKKLINFIDPSLVDEAWIQQAAALVRPVRSSWQALPAHEQELLASACQPGFEVLEKLQKESLPVQSY